MSSSRVEKYFNNLYFSTLEQKLCISARPCDIPCLSHVLLGGLNSPG